MDDVIIFYILNGKKKQQKRTEQIGVCWFD